VPTSEIESHLALRAGLTQGDARLAARVTNGSVGKALALDINWFSQARDLLLGVLDSALVTGSLAAMLQTSEQINDAKNKDRFEDVIVILESLIRDVFAVSKGADARTIANTDIADRLAALANEVTTPKIEHWIAEIEELQFNFLVNINRKVATDGLFVKMARQ
jgi:DNA polymerase-3 subunit delta'